jgi:hypothetical protein
MDELPFQISSGILQLRINLKYQKLQSEFLIAQRNLAIDGYGHSLAQDCWRSHGKGRTNDQRTMDMKRHQENDQTVSIGRSRENGDCDWVLLRKDRNYRSARNSGHIWNNGLSKESDIQNDWPVTRNGSVNRKTRKEKLLLIAHEESRSL